MVKSRPRYSKEFKVRVCQEVASGATVAEVSRKHDVHPNLVYRWCTLYRQKPDKAFAKGSGQKTPDTTGGISAARTAELERLVGRLTLENEFLKKMLSAVETTFGRLPPSDGTR